MFYSNSFKSICRGDIPIGSSLVVDLSTLPPNPSACPRVGVWDKPWDKFANYFETASSQFRFCPGDKKTGEFWGSEPSEMDTETADCPLWRLFSEVNRSQRLYRSAFPQVG